MGSRGIVEGWSTESQWNGMLKSAKKSTWLNYHFNDKSLTFTWILVFTERHVSLKFVHAGRQSSNNRQNSIVAWHHKLPGGHSEWIKRPCMLDFIRETPALEHENQVYRWTVNMGTNVQENTIWKCSYLIAKDNTKNANQILTNIASMHPSRRCLLMCCSSPQTIHRILTLYTALEYQQSLLVSPSILLLSGPQMHIRMGMLLIVEVSSILSKIT